MAVSCLGTLGWAGWIYLGRGLDPVGGMRDVTILVAVCWLELGLAAWAYHLLRRRSERLVVALVLAFGLLFRLTMLPAGAPASAELGDLVAELGGSRVVYDPYLLYDNDVWRYLWDGRVQQVGFDPYRSTPASIERTADAGDRDAEALLDDEVWWEIHQRIGYPEHPSVYPPLAQLLFRGLATMTPGSVLALKLLLTMADVGLCVLLVALLARLGRPPAAVVLYAWHPLPIKEIAGSGHLDGLMTAALVAAVLALVAGAHRRALALWATAIALKMSPAVLAGLVFGRTSPRRWWWAAAIFLTVSLPFLTSLPAWIASLASFAGTWRFNAGAWALAGILARELGADDPAAWADAICGLALLATVAGVTVVALRASPERRNERLVWATFVALAAVPLLAPAVMPWYLLWALPFAVAAGRWSFPILGGLVFLSYFVYVDQREQLWWLVTEHGVFALLAGLEARWHGRRGA